MGTAFAGAGILLESGMRDRLVLAWRLLRDPRVAPVLKLLAPVAALIYLVSPIDLIPDFLLGLGQVDDLGVIALMVIALTRLLPRLASPEVLREHVARMGMSQASEEERGEEAEQVVDAAYRFRR